jgi:hypothetical protein
MRLVYSQLHRECAHACAQNLLLCSDQVSLVPRSLPCCIAHCCWGTSTPRIGGPSTHNNKPPSSTRLRILCLKLPCYFSFLRSGPTIGLQCHALPIMMPSWRLWPPPCSTNWPARSGSSSCPMPHLHHLLLHHHRRLLPPQLLASRLVSESSSSAEGNRRDALAPLWSFMSPCSGWCISRLPQLLRPAGSTRSQEACNFSIPDHTGPLSMRLFLVTDSLRGCFSLPGGSFLWGFSPTGGNIWWGHFRIRAACAS